MLTKKSLRELKQEGSTSELKKSVITDLLSQGTTEEIKNYLSNVLRNGCQSGVVTSLIYYTDTEKFFKRHYNDILEIAEEIRQEYGELNFELSANNLAWKGYEYTCGQIANELDFEW